VTTGGEDDIWAQAFTGVYPFEQPNDAPVESAVGMFQIDGEMLSIAGTVVELPFVPSILAGYNGDVRLFTTGSEEQAVPLLLVSEDFFFRFDHLTNV
jgi:hypothetical protein